MQTTFRAAREGDIPALTDIECRAFRRDGAEARAFKQEELARELADYVVLAEGPRPVACARVQRHWLALGASRVLKADVGHVAVLPEAQGQGLGTALMQQLLPYQREQGFHLSRLGGLMRFYSRFGYEPFLRRYVQIPVRPVDEDLKGYRWGDLLAIPKALGQCTKFYNPSRDAAAVHALRWRCYGQRPGQGALDEAPPAPTTAGVDLKVLEWVYEVDGEVRGYLRGGFGLVHADDTAPSFRLDDLAYDPDCPQAVEALVKTLIWRAMHRAPTVISCRLPYDERLFEALTAAGIAFDVVERREAMDGNMIRVVDLQGLLAAIAPELTRRLAEAGPALWRGQVRFELPGLDGVLDLGGEGEAVVRCSHAQFVKGLFGIAGFAEMPDLGAGLTAVQRGTLGVLFPRTACASGPWG